MNSRLLIATTAVAALTATWLFAQGGGPLTPPGAPAPTMKTLQQIEPRIPLVAEAGDTPAVMTSDGAYHFILKQPGSYYLVGNVDVTKTNGIAIRAAGVSLDLNGFTIRRTAGSGGNGIEVAATSDRCAVKNGALAGFFHGLSTLSVVVAGEPVRSKASAASGISASACSSGFSVGNGWLVSDCRASGNTANGIAGGAVIENCVAEKNGTTGIVGSKIFNCTATGNGGVGINGSVIEGCLAISNGGDGITGINVSGCTALLNEGTGIFGSLVTRCSSQENEGDGIGGTTISDCSAFRNAGVGISARHVSGCSASFNDRAGIQTDPQGRVTGCQALYNGAEGYSIDQGTEISGCLADGNTGDGIRATTRCVIRDNLCDDNDGFGIHTTGIRNRIDGNQVTANDVGIKVDAATNLIIRNTATGNTPNWQIAANNNIGPIIVPINSPAINGNSGGSGVATTDPWANFSY